MRAVRRLLGSLAVAMVTVSAVTAVAPAQAQGSAVTLQLLRQSPWSRADHRSALEVAVLATNTGAEPVSDMSLVVSFGTHYLSRGDFERSLSSGPSSVIATASKIVRGELGAGSARTIEFTIDLSSVEGIDQTDSQTYPAVLELRTGDSALASLLTPVIYLARAPAAPMLSTTWVSLPAPVAIDPGGTLVDPSFQAAIAPDGALRAPLDAIEATVTAGRSHGALDLVVDPLVVTQSRDLDDGYRLMDGTEVSPEDDRARAAGAFLRKLTAVVSSTRSIETVANPYANPLLPAMLSSGLAAELAGERVAGATVLASVGASPATTVASPSGGQLSDEALAWLAGVGSTVVLAEADTVDRSTVQGALAPAPTVPVSTPAGQTTLVLPDPSTQTLFARSDLLGDPVRAAQVVLGELAVIWKEEPVPIPPTLRGVAVAPPSTIPPGMWAPLLERLTTAPFLTPVAATALASQVSPSNPNPELPLQTPSILTFDPAYAASIDALGRSVDAYSSMLENESEVPTQLRRDLFIATAPAFVVDPVAGEPWLAAVRDVTGRAFASVTPTVSEAFTFTSREGTIPLVMGDPGETPLRVTVELRSARFSFPDGDSQEVVVERPGQVVRFRVVANASGQNPIQVLVRAPNGRAVTQPITIVVRSTTVNHIALLVTLAAGLGLLALYSRRWFRRRRNRA